MKTLVRKLIIGGAVVLSSILGFKDADGQEKINPFVQPNDSTLNWYGSGDVSNKSEKDKNIININDLNRLDSLIAGTFTDKKDKRLYDRVDVNGDGVVDGKDKKILEDYLNGTILYLPGQWNKLPTREEREDWLKKMLAIDKTDTLAWIKDEWNCNAFTLQTYINFHGHQGFIPSKFNTTNNGRFNIPLYTTYVKNKGFPKSSIAYLHEFNWIFMGDNALDYIDGKAIEPQTDEEVKIGGWNLSKDSSEVRIRKISKMVDDGQWPQDLVKFSIQDSIPSLSWYSPNLQLTRDTGTAVKDEKHENVVPIYFDLKQNYPNPFNGETTIPFSLEKGGYVGLIIYNILGQEVKKLVDGYKNQGQYKATWDGTNNAGKEVASGIYLSTLREDGKYVKPKKIVKIN